MIVRDEAHIIEECLRSVAPVIDHWIVVDTGSVDDTAAIVEAFFAERGIPGAVHHRPWRDFGTNRSEALELCRGQADYAFVMDADDVLVGTPDLGGLTADGYLVPMSEGIEFWRALLLRLDRPWRYEGVVHEYPTCGDEPTDLQRLDGDARVMARRLGARNADPDKYRRDAELLEGVVAEDPDDTRATFYLAQSWFDAGDHEAALHWYGRRAEMGGWEEEVFIARYRMAQALERLDRPWAEVQDAHLVAWQSRPSRAEPLVDLARHHRIEGRFDVAHLFARQAAVLPYPTDDLLFVHADAHRWQALDELAISAFYTGHHQESFAVASRLLDGPHLPDTEWERVLANRDFTVDAVKPDTLTHPEAVVAWLVERGPDPDPEVTLTITTCRRPDLFDATMRSFLNCCADLDRIGRWLLVDDGSEPADRDRMLEAFPFFELVEKSPEEAGHAGSMEALRRAVTSPWWLHLEDDWHFVVPGRWVSRAIEVLDADPGIGQVLFNRNYGEVLDDRRLVGGEADRTPAGRRFRRHVHHPAGTPAHDDYLAAFGPEARSNAWWPHFSLRPSMLRTAAMAEVGAFLVEADHFELDHAERYTAAGWSSAFIDQILGLHLGPRTFDPGADRTANAYDLSGRPQFGALRDAVTRLAVLPSWTTPEAVVAQWSRQSPDGDGRWGQTQLVADAIRADLTLVLNGPPDGLIPDPARTVVAPVEPLVGQVRWPLSARRALLQVRDHARYGNLWEWHLGRTHTQLRDEPILKDRDLSVVVSNRQEDEAQRRRLALAHHLQDSGVAIDVYGRSEGEGFTDHRGRLPALDKTAGLFPYRYTIAVENHAEPGYVTEKLVDAVLSECLTFYWGAPDVGDLVDPAVLVPLPLEDPEACRRLIVATIRSGVSEQRLPAIQAEKRRILDEAQALPVLDRLARGWRAAEALQVRVVNLDRRPDRWAALAAHLGEVAPALWAKVERWPAVDGRDLTRTEDIGRIFAHNDFGWRRGVIGCALSHRALWREVAEADGPSLVLEDDVRADEGAWGELVEALGLVVTRHPDVDLGFLGFTPWPGRPSRARPDVLGPLRWQPVPWAEYQGGTASYLLSPAGARKLLALVEARGMVTAVDEFLRRSAPELNVLELYPHLFVAPVVAPGLDVDSEIQADPTPVP